MKESPFQCLALERHIIGDVQEDQINSIRLDGILNESQKVQSLLKIRLMIQIHRHINIGIDLWQTSVTPRAEEQRELDGCSRLHHLFQSLHINDFRHTSWPRLRMPLRLRASWL